MAHASPNPFGEKQEPETQEKVDNTRPTLPKLPEDEVIKAPNEPSKPVVPESKLFSSEVPKVKEPEPTSYFKYMNGNSTDNQMPKNKEETPIVNSPIGEIKKEENKIPSSIDEVINKKREDLPELSKEVNIQEESNISVSNHGVKKNINVELPKDSKLENTVEQPGDLIHTSGLPVIQSTQQVEPKKKFPVLSVVVITIIVLSLLVFSIPVMSALGTTRDNAFSGLSLAFPVDTLPIFSTFAKSPKLMIADIFNKPLSSMGEYKSLSEKINADIKVSGTTTDNDLSSTTLNLIASNKSNSSGSGQFSLNIGGTLGLNGEQFEIDPNSLGIETTSISEDEIYLKYMVSDKLTDILFPSTTTDFEFNLLKVFNKYNDKYIKFSDTEKVLTPDDPDFFKPKVKSPTSQFNAFMIDQSAFYEEMSPKFKTFIADTLERANKVVEVVNEGRVKVQNTESIKLRVKFDKANFKTFQKETLDSTAKFLFDNVTPISRLYCASYLRSFSSNSVKTSDIEECSTSFSKETSLENIKTSLSDLNYLDINSIVIYVNAVNNDLTKLTINFSFDIEAYIASNPNSTKYSGTSPRSVMNPVEVSLDYETIKSDKEISIFPPDVSISYESFLVDIENLIQEIFMVQSD